MVVYATVAGMTAARERSARYRRDMPRATRETAIREAALVVYHAQADGETFAETAARFIHSADRRALTAIDGSYNAIVFEYDFSEADIPAIVARAERLRRIARSLI